MTDEKIYDLACMFKDAILSALAEGFFENDDKFCRFPKGCCGDTCYLLASFLKNYGVETLYVWGDYGMRSHAWLVINDNRVKKPTPRYIEIKNEYAEMLRKYGEEIDGPIKDARYRVRDLTNGLVVDITADQFGGPSVYVGKRNDFYCKHTFRSAHICDGIENDRLYNLYRKVSLFLP